MRISYVIDLAARRGMILAAIGCIVPAPAALADSLTVRVVDEHGAALQDVAMALKPLVGVPAMRAAEFEIVQRDKRFIPLMTAVPTGASIRFPNHDTVRHHVYSFSPAKTFELKLYLGTPAAPVVFDKPGVVVMGCNIHDHMVAYVVVFDSPWVGVSDEAGKLRLQGVPAGDYRLEYWHPRWVGADNSVAGTPVRIDGDARFTLVVGAQP